MADDHGLRFPPRPETRPVPVTPKDRSKSSYEAGEPSATGSLRDVTPSTGRSRASGSDDIPPDSSPVDPHHQSAPKDGRLTRRKNKFRSAGTFLLQEVVGGDQGTRRKSRSLLPVKGTTHPRTPEQKHTHSSHDSGSNIGSEKASAKKESTPSIRPDEPRLRPSPHSSTKGEANDTSSPTHRASLDADSTQIVHMALNLSESRRMASRRNPSRSNPPRLAPLPDVTSRSNLKQHLNQQRRSSRTESPKPTISPRSPSGLKANSPLHAGFDEYHYQFSESTLARAQKAKDHLELMGEYRRLLHYLPPLKPCHDRHYATSPPQSPGLGPKTFKFNSYDTTSKRGRPYNPLQYVRNRKVRARERKVIDGEQQGFSDVEMVRTWVDRISHRDSVASSTTSDDIFSMPAFARADEAENQTSVRVRRPRVDWFTDPSDMIADAYWLEQDHHKELIEDRLWRKVFPPTNDIAHPITNHADENGAGFKTGQTRTADGEKSADGHDMRQVPTEDTYQAGTRERAKQKIQDLRGFGHRHTGSHPHHDFLGMRRESISDADASDADGKAEKSRKGRQGRRETITSDANDLLQKQMMDIVSQEARETELAHVPEHAVEDQYSPESRSPLQKALSEASSQPQSRKISLAEISDSDSKIGSRMSRWGSPTRHNRGRPSFETPEGLPRVSLSDVDTSVPTSPQLGATRDHTNLPPVANTSAYSSRSGSPTRRTLSKVKKKLLEKSREPGLESQSEAEEESDHRAPVPEPPSLSEKLITRATEESNRSHRSASGKKYREEDSVGLRSLFKGTRIDTLVRTGASKVGDLIWKKDTPAVSDEESSSELESDAVKETKSRPSMSRRDSSRRDVNSNAKHFYDAMPEFHPIAETNTRPTTRSRKPSATDISRVSSQRSPRWEQLKPPRIDVQSALPTTSPSDPSKRIGESDASESDSYQPSVPDAVRAADKRLNSIIGRSSQSRSTSRHWSITDRSSSPEHTQISRREVARMRTLMLSSGIKAMEISRRAHEAHRPLHKISLSKAKRDPRLNVGGIDWREVSKLSPDCKELQDQQVPACEVYPLASRALGKAIQKSGQRWQASADQFTTKTTPALHSHIWKVHSRITDDLSQLTRQAADDADETSKELALDQPLKVKHVVDVIEKLLRKRRRRFRWVRRGMWLGVEWVLVGFMWYVWFVVMILRVFLGVGKGVINGARWLLWL